MRGSCWLCQAQREGGPGCGVDIVETDIPFSFRLFLRNIQQRALWLPVPANHLGHDPQSFMVHRRSLVGWEWKMISVQKDCMRDHVFEDSTTVTGGPRTRR